MLVTTRSATSTCQWSLQGPQGEAGQYGAVIGVGSVSPTVLDARLYRRRDGSRDGQRGSCARTETVADCPPMVAARFAGRVPDHGLRVIN